MSKNPFDTEEDLIFYEYEVETYHTIMDRTKVFAANPGEALEKVKSRYWLSKFGDPQEIILLSETPIKKSDMKGWMDEKWATFKTEYCDRKTFDEK